MPIGSLDVINNFPYQDIRDYYAKWYRPDLQGIMIVGDINVDEMEAKLKKVFADVKAPVHPANRIYYPVADNQEPLIFIGTDKEIETPSISFFFKSEAFPDSLKNTINYYGIQYMLSMGISMLNSRLAEIRQQADPPFTGASAGYGDFFVAKTKSAFGIDASSKIGGIELAMKTILEEAERARRFGFTETEYDRARANYLQRVESAYNEREKMKNDTYVNEYISNFLDNEPMPGIEYEYAMMNKLAPNIPVTAINQVMQQLITDNNQVVLLAGPEKEGLKYPTKEEITALLKQMKSFDLKPYEDKVSNEPLLKEEPKGGKIISEKAGDIYGTTKLVLSNGVKVYIKPTDYKADQILMKGTSLGGSSQFADKEILNISQINGVALVGGIGNFNKVDLGKALAGKRASVGAGVSATTETVSGSCSPKDFETMMQLTYLTFTAPRKDNEAFESYKNRLKAELQNADANPMTAFSDTISYALYGNHPRSFSMKEEDVDKIDYDRVLEMYKDRFKDASDFTFIFVGNIKPEEVEPLIATYLGALPSVNRKETFRDNHIDMRQGDYKNIFSKKLETPKASVLVINNGKCAYTLKNQIMMSMLSQILNIMYTESVREKEGGTYGVSAFGSLTKYPKEKAVLQIYFDTDPAKRAKMTDIILNELNQFVDQGPSAENLNKVKEFMLKKYKENAKENSYWVNILGEYFWEGTDMNTGYTNTVNSITAKDLQEFTKALLEQNNRVEVSMTSEETK